MGIVKIFNRSTRQEGIDRCRTSDLIITNKFVVDKTFLNECPNIKFICVAATGYNNIDIEECKKRNIVVSNVGDYSSASVAQLVFAFILHILNAVSKHNSSVKKGYWSICPDFSFSLLSIQELKGLTLGLYGYGNIAKKVAIIAKAFEMEVIASSASRTSGKEDGLTFVDTNTLLNKSDVLSLHAALNPKTIGFINKASLRKMKSSAILINTGRGGLIIEHDLAEALYEGQIKAAALDVLNEEPAPLSHPFYKLSNCILTPHIAWSSLQSRKRLMQGVADNLKAFLDGNPINVV